MHLVKMCPDSVPPITTTATFVVKITHNSLSSIKVVGNNINPNTDTYHMLLEGKGARFVESLELLERMV